MGGGDARASSGRKAIMATWLATTTDLNGAADSFLSRSAAGLETTSDKVLRRKGTGAAPQKETMGLSSPVADFGERCLADVVVAV